MCVATERETSDNTEATRFSQCAHDQRRRLEAEDCDSIRCAQLISGGRRRIRPPCTVPHSRSPHNVLHSPSINILRISAPATPLVWGSLTLASITSYVKEAPGVQIRHARRRRPAMPIPIASYAARACCGTGRPTVDVGRETRQPIRATSRDRLSSDTLEEMEARLMSRAARMLIARATVLPRVCAGEARRNTSSVACARAVVLHV